MIFAFAGNDALATKPNYSWFHFTVNVKARVKTADGLVYDRPEIGSVYAKIESNSSETENQDRAHTHPGDDVDVTSYPLNSTLHAIPEAGFKFLYWTKEDGTIINASPTEQNDGKATVKCNATRRCFWGNGGASDSDHDKSHTSLVNQYGTYSNIFNYYAVFEPIKASIAVKSNNTSIGRAICSKYDNDLGDEVTIKAYCVDYDTKFLGWEVNGEIIQENPYTFTVTNEASDDPIIYTAIFENGYNFHRIRNYVTKNYLNAISDDGNIETLVSGGAITSLELKTNDLNDVMYEAGSIVDIYYARIPNDTRYYYDYFVQGAKASKYYDFDPNDPTSSTSGVFLRMPFDAKTYTNTWAFATANEGGYRFTDNNGTPKITIGERPESQWYIECVDKDLNTKENYFSLDPNKLVEVNGKYYTTLRTSWNILFNPDQMTPYVVTEVDEANGTFDMEPITGNNDNVNNIIPAGTPVIIETKSKVVLDNRMVPTTTPFAGTIPEPNKLETSEKYFPNQSAPVDNCKGLINANGQLAFGGNALSTVNGNEAYLSVDNEVVKIETLPLSEIEQVGVKNRKYIVEDLLIAVAYAEDTEGSSFLWCKDQGDKSSIFATTIHDGEQVDFLLNDENAQNGRAWDQSNWVALKFTGLTTDEAAVIRGYVNSYINEKAITGELVDDNNYMLKVSAKTLATTAGASYKKNVYCTSNFVLDNLNIFGSIAEGDGGYTSGNTAQNYFFMNPKVQEVCHIIYAMWDAQNSCFTVPTISGFAGNFNVDLAYNDNPNLNLSTALADESVYQFDAVVNRVSKTAYGAKGNRAGEFKVYPTNLTGEGNIVTAINGIYTDVNREVVGVEYVNVAGMISDKPFQGVNIVVTRYNDGSKTTSKKVFK